MDEHPFWRIFIRVIDPQDSYSILKTAIDTNEGRPFSSSRQAARISLFCQAKRNTAHVCIPCRVHVPRLPSGRHIALPENTERHPQLGRVPICPHHVSTTCDNCLQYQESMDTNSPEVKVDIGLRYIAKRQRNELGQRMTDESMICAECRKEILRGDLLAELRYCSRGNPVPTGVAHSIAEMDEYAMMDLSPAARRYLDHGQLLSTAVAAHLLNELWLSNHLRDLIDVQGHIAESLQDLESTIRRQFVLGGRTASPQQRALRIVLGQKLAAPGSVDVEDVDHELNILYRTLSELKRNALDRDDLIAALEDAEEDEDFGLSDRVSRATRVCESGGLNIAQWKRATSQAAIDWWAWYRVMTGLWIDPSTEAALLASAVPESPSTVNLPAVKAITEQNVDRGLPFKHPSDADPLFTSPLGCVHLEKADDSRMATFLPSQKFARDDLTQAFNATLVRLVYPAMAKLVNILLETYGGDTVKTEKVCAAQSFEQVMAALAEPTVWTKAPFAWPLPPAIEHMAGDVMPIASEDFIVFDVFPSGEAASVVEIGDDEPMKEEVEETQTDRPSSLEHSTGSLASSRSRKRKSPVDDKFSPRKISKVDLADDGNEAAILTPKPSDTAVPSPDPKHPASADTLAARIAEETSSLGSESEMSVPADQEPNGLAYLTEDPTASSDSDSGESEVTGDGVAQGGEVAAGVPGAIPNGRHIHDDGDESSDTSSEASREPSLTSDAYGHIGVPPIVPRIGPDVPAEMLDSQLIMTLWDDVRGKMLRRCRCGICVRAKREEERLDVLRSEAQSREGDADRQMALSLFLGMLAEG